MLQRFYESTLPIGIRTTASGRSASPASPPIGTSIVFTNNFISQPVSVSLISLYPGGAGRMPSMTSMLLRTLSSGTTSASSSGQVRRPRRTASSSV
jgi:hypothetical protein